MTSQKSKNTKTTAKKTRATVAKRSIRPFKQGNFDGCCSLYSLINAVRSTGFKLNQAQAQSLTDAVLGGMKASAVKDLILNGADHSDLMRIFRFLNAAMKEQFCHTLKIVRPFRRGKFDLKTVLKKMKEERNNGGGVIVWISGEDFNHYSVFNRIDDKKKMRFIDSDHLPSIPVKDVSLDDEKEYRLHIRNVYFLRVREAG